MAAVGAQMRWSARRDRHSRPRLPAPPARSRPAPSPNSTQVVRSFQSRMREKVSAPITSARLCEPEARNLSAVATAKTKPAHTACRSKATPPVMPKLRLDHGRDRGKGVVGRRGGADDEVDVLGRAVRPWRARRAPPPRRASRWSRPPRRDSAG